MPSVGEIVRTYRDLAEIYGHRGEEQMRDRFLVLAADAALTAGRADEAERLRADLLEHNPHHLLKPFASLGEALKSADVRNYVSALRRSHPYERAEHLLESLSGTADEAAAGQGAVPSAGQSNQAQASEELQIFRVREEEESRPPPARAQVSRPVRPVPAVPSPARQREIYAVQPEPLRPTTDHLNGGDDQDRGNSRWISVVLFLLLLAAGGLLALHALVRPLIP
jgi:hypothetical protein